MMIAVLRQLFTFAHDLIIRKRWFTAVISLVLTALIFSKINMSKLWMTLLEVDFPQYLVGLGLILIYLIVKSKRWQLLLRSQNIICSTYTAFIVYNIGSLYGLLTPGRIGDFVKVYHLSSSDKSSGINALWGTLYDRLLDVTILLILNILTVFILKDLIPQLQQIFWLTTFILLGCIALILLLVETNKFIRRINVHFGEYIDKRLDSAYFLHFFSKNLVEPMLRLRSLSVRDRLLISCLTVIIWVILFGAYYVFSWSLHLQIPLSLFVGITSLAMLASNLPISFSGVGVRDLSLIFLLSVIGIDKHSSLSLSWLVFSTYLFSALIGAGALVFRSGLLHRLSESIKETWIKSHQ